MIYEEVEIYTRKRAREHVLLSSWYFHSHLLEEKPKNPRQKEKSNSSLHRLYTATATPSFWLCKSRWYSINLSEFIRFKVLELLLSKLKLSTTISTTTWTNSINIIISINININFINKMNIRQQHRQLHPQNKLKLSWHLQLPGSHDSSLNNMSEFACQIWAYIPPNQTGTEAQQTQ